MKKLKIWNGRDWYCRGGHLFVCAYSQKDAVELSNEAYRKVSKSRGEKTTLSEVRKYWSMGYWGNDMKDITPERGVWWTPQQGGFNAQPIKRIL